MNELREQKEREITITGPLRPDKKVRQIFEALQRSGPEGEKLAAIFRRVADSKTIVDQLMKAMSQNKFIEEARQILTKAAASFKEENEKKLPNKLKRVCWCYFKKW